MRENIEKDQNRTCEVSKIGLPLSSNSNLLDINENSGQDNKTNITSQPEKKNERRRKNCWGSTEDCPDSWRGLCP